MAPGSPSAIQAIPDRPITERPETKSTDATDGHFASLLAQYARNPKVTKAPEPSHTRPARLDKGSRAQPTKTKTAAGPQVLTASVEPSPRAAGPIVTRAAVKDAKAIDAKPGTDAKNAKADPEQPGAPAQVNQASDDAAAAVAGPLSSLLPMGVIPTKDQVDEASAALTAAGVEAAAQVSNPGDLMAQLAGVLPEVPMGTPSPAIPAQPETFLPVGMGSPAKSGNASDPSGLPAKDGAADPLQPNQQTLPLIDPTQSKPQAPAQAVIAELASRMKNGSKPEGSVAPADASGSDATRVVKSMKIADVQALSLERIEAQANPTMGPMPADSEAPSSGGDGKSSILPSANPESALPMLDALAVRSAMLAQTPILRAADGSALAVSGLLPRAGETLAVSTPAAPLAPAALPQAPVIQVEGGLRWMLKGGVQEAELQLHPDSLGQVTIHLRVEGGEVHARLWITEPTSMQAVQEGRPHLEMALKEQGLQLGSFDLQQGHRPFQEASTTPSYPEPAFQESAPTRQEAPASPSTSILNSHHVELYA